MIEFQNVSRRFMLPQGPLTAIENISFQAKEGLGLKLQKLI